MDRPTISEPAIHSVVVPLRIAEFPCPELQKRTLYAIMLLADVDSHISLPPVIAMVR